MEELQYLEQAPGKWMNEKNKIMKDVIIYRCVWFIPAEVIVDCPMEETRFELKLQEKWNFYNIWLKKNILDNENWKA